MLRWLTIVLITLVALMLLSSSALPGQTLFSRGPQQTVGSASIEGVVVRADTGAPVAGAQVLLGGGSLGLPPMGPPTAVMSVGGGGGGTLIVSTLASAGAVPLAGGSNAPSFTTGSDGRYSFTSLRAGSYRMTVTASGFARQEYGQRVANAIGRTLYLTDGQAVRDVAIRLVPNGAVGGRVFDENSQPATGAAVYIVQTVYTDRGADLRLVGESNADDRGDFRVFGVPPGRYYVLAGSAPGSGRPILSGGARGPAPRFNLVYYPNGEAFNQALPVDVSPGAESYIDVRVRRQPQTFHVRGRVVSADRSPVPANVSVSLAYRFLGGGGAFSSGRMFDPATGTFDLANVPPGDYALQAQVPQVPSNAAGPVDAASAAARQAEQASRLFGDALIRVADTDVNDVLITMSRGVPALGRVTVEGQTAAIPNVERMRLTVSFVATPMGATPAPVAFAPAADGTFQVVGLRPGEYRAHFSSAGGGLHVKNIRFGGIDIASAPFRFDGMGSGTFEVILVGSSTGRAAGVVNNAQSQPVPGVQVILIPSQRSRTDLYRFGITNAAGRFSFGSLPLGDFKIFSWESVANGAYYDTDYMRQYEGMGSAIRVTDGSAADVAVRLIPAP